ncbi:transglutaminase family protein [Hoylesella loescheii]|uniref:transglutaminase-like domain-containing protein n=1 Tax=Hoylesella loescheii TaxID=840 RepID=UPI0026EBC153|nr:transglutaminase domain-containing protein [Hoylesella loescheii]
MKKLLLSLFIALTAFNAAQAGYYHFISDDKYRAQVHKDFTEKMQLVGKNFFSATQSVPSVAEQEALEFLYAYMPVADVTDYTTTFYLDNVKAAFKAREEMPWGRTVPELLFRHFVMPIRVNNENLDNARIVLYDELKKRVEGLSMTEAILELNHWCHEHVTYQPSNARTLSPLACMKTAIGRCGEESTFTVAVLRTLGIPARQVYTPRWAHTDDNHAWVEAWADGQWHFLGACEPEPVLNLGWFNLPASRAMLMHTKAFGNYRGPEEVMLRTNNYTEINLIGNYAPTARIDFMVVDAAGKAVDKAKVEFKIYNYAEYYTAVNKFTDNRGRTFLTAGVGDMMVWASKNGAYGFAKASFGKDKSITIRLTRSARTDAKNMVGTLDSTNIVPPVESAKLPEVSPEQAEANKLRLVKEDSIRHAYEATFYKPKKDGKVGTFLKKARGNWQTIYQFINSHTDRMDRALDLLATLPDKDLQDISLDILEDHFNAQSDQLSPRVEDEMIIAPFKQSFQEAFNKGLADSMRVDPTVLVDWTKHNIKLNPDTKALRIAQTPMGVWRSRLTDTRSRDIFFVSMARSLGIESRKDAVTGKVQYKRDSVWVDVDFDNAQQQVTPTGRLKLTYTAVPLLPSDPKYYSHFTLSKIVDGQARLLNFEEGDGNDNEGTTWANTFKNGYDLDAGTYLLVTGTRLANGGVLATHRFFNIAAGKTTEVALKMRRPSGQLNVLGNFDSESRFFKDGQEVSILSQTGRGYFTLALLGIGEEPTNHALRDLAKARATLDEWGRPFVLLFPNDADLQRFKNENFGTLPANIILGVDAEGKIRQQVAQAMKLANPSQMPVFIVADTFNRVVFCSQGYTIGMGEQLEKVAKMLETGK